MKDKPIIIVGEDNHEMRWLYKRWLEEDGFGVIEADDGAWVLAQMEPNTPDLVILDLHLPSLSGLEVCRRLKSSEQYGLIPVIAVAATLDQSAKFQAHQCGADAMLVKPISRVELTTLVRRLLGVQADPGLDDEISKLESRLWAHLGD